MWEHSLWFSEKLWNAASVIFIHSFIHPFTHSVIADLHLTCCLAVTAGFRSGRVTSSSQTTNLTMLPLGGSDANAALYIFLVASSLKSQIKSWSCVFYFLFFHSEIQFPWQQPSLHFYLSSFIRLRLFLYSRSFFSFTLCRMCVPKAQNVKQVEHFS